MKLPSKKTLIIGGVALVVAGIVFVATRKPKISYETETVDRGSVIHEITVTGSIAPFEKIQLQPEVSGRIARIPVTEGTEVKAGDLLLELDMRDIAARVASQRASVDSARARYDELVAGATDLEIARSEAAVAAARSRRDAAVSAEADARTALANAEAKAGSQLDSKHETLLLDYDASLTSGRDSIERLTSQLFTTNDFLTFSTNNTLAESDAVSTRGTAKLRLTDLEALVASVRATATPERALDAYAGAASDLAGIKAHLEACRTVLGYTSGLSTTTLSTYQSNVSTALSAIDAAASSLAVSRAALDLQIKLNAADLSAARAALSSAEFSADAAEKALAQAEADLAVTKSGTRREVIAAQRARVSAEEATLAGLLADLEKRRIKAPVDGVVTDVAVSVGETASPSVPAVTMNAKGRFEILANVSEVDIARVRTGQPVGITLDAFPQTEKWTGKVAFIEPAEKVVEGVIFYETRFAFDAEDERLRSGMTANLSIEAERRDDAVRVPLRAIKERDGRPYVEVLVDGAVQERAIETGVENNQYAEVLSGLTAGETVVTGTMEGK